MGNLFVVYGDALSDELRFLVDVMAVPAYGGEMKPQDELTHRLFESSADRKLQHAIMEKYGEKIMNCGEVRKIDCADFLVIYTPILYHRSPITVNKNLAGMSGSVVPTSQETYDCFCRA